MEPKTQTTAQTPPVLRLPVMVYSPADLSRLLHELDNIQESLLQLGLRTGGRPVKMPRTSRLMDQVIELNKLNLLHDDQRQALRDFLQQLREHAPVLHMSFSADPDAAFIERLMTWLRREIDPMVLLSVGLQPNLGAGCIVRSTNKYFDLSLRQNFERKRDLLAASLAPEAKA